MASYSQVKYGSQGDDVKTLQTMLNNNGYSLSVDGIFGSATQSAVKDYQKKNNLAVDGIVGTNTWGALTGGSSGSTSGKGAVDTTPASAADQGFFYKVYEESDAVKQSQTALDDHLAAKPQDYTPSQYQTIADEALQQYLNRGDFSYDVNADALYQQYKDKYIQQGKMAMMDTVGQAAALTGGYGNSYAVTAGNQAYQSHLQNLNDVVPELYQMAYDRYNQEGQDLINQYGIAADRENQEYSKYQDALAAWKADRDYYSNQYNAERDYDYGKYSSEKSFDYGAFSDSKAYAYQQERDKKADEQWQMQFDEAKRQYDASLSAATGGSSSGSSGSGGTSSGSGGRSSGSGGSNYDTHGYTTDQIKSLQRAAGITADGVWGAQTQKAYEAGYRPTSNNNNNNNNNSGGFTGTTYSEAVAYLKSQGVPNGTASGIMTAAEWRSRKARGGTGGETLCNTYTEYLRYIVEYML